MQQTFNFFDAEEPSLKRHLTDRLRHLACARIYIGSSSWKFKGWLGSIYHPERYSTRGRFSTPRFERRCLEEYAEIFHTVSGDFAFYQFPGVDFWNALFAQVPSSFQFAFKAPEEITTPVFPKHRRYGARAGLLNPSFLDHNLFIDRFLRPLEPYAHAVGVIMLEFPAVLSRAFANTGSLLDALYHFLHPLPRTFRYAVEIRSEPLFCPEYCRTLRDLGVAHIFNSWTDMPPIGQQLAEPEAFTADFTVSRALMKPGNTYQQTVSAFSPYCLLQQPDLETRSALRDLLTRSRQRREPIFIYVNNRLEGFAPGTIAALIDAI